MDEDGATLVCSDDFVALEADHGWRDAWRHVHGDRREYTWWSKRKGGGLNQGFRLDHIFASPPAVPRVLACCYSQTERESGTSDHAAQVLDLR